MRYKLPLFLSLLKQMSIIWLLEVL
jgi:hypothetical protein